MPGVDHYTLQSRLPRRTLMLDTLLRQASLLMLATPRPPKGELHGWRPRAGVVVCIPSSVVGVVERIIVKDFVRHSAVRMPACRCRSTNLLLGGASVASALIPTLGCRFD